MVRKRVGLWLGPLLFLLVWSFPAPFKLGPEAWKMVAMALWMLTWWVTECVSLPVTAILPLAIMPLLQIEGLTIKEVAAPYANHIVFLFMGGFMIALAMEKWRLHRRIALNIVRITGTNANGIILGFMLATWVLSMWISNTATTIMMLPIALSVITLLVETPNNYDPKGIHQFAMAIMLGIAYAANIGGTTTIIGTPPTVVFAGFIREQYGFEVDFASWLMVGFPFALILFIGTYLILVKWLYRNGLGRLEGAASIIQSELEALGPMSSGEIKTLVVFLSTAVCWIFRSFINGWFPGLTDTGIAMLSTVALFVLPIDLKFNQFVLDWRDTDKLPWGILLLFGGGLTLANGLQHVGIIDMIGGQFESAVTVSLAVILGLTAVSLYLTEIMSNLALVTVFLPVVGGIAIGLDVDPLLLCIPVTLAASCAFMLPMSTPPNAIVFASGHLKVSDMVKAGFVLNILTILWIAVLSQYLIPWVFT